MFKNIKRGILVTGEEWALTESRKKAPEKYSGEPIRGRHLILQFADKLLTEDVGIDLAVAMYQQAYQLAAELCFEPGRFRICQNGPKVCTRPHFHLHIILPEKGEELVSIVTRPKD